MQPFTILTAVAAPMPLINIDTDMIIPKQYLKTIKRTGLGQFLFDEMRRSPEGEERADFVLNQPAYHHAQILVTGENFGCGSSREHAPWALLDYGIRSIIAPSFADIFYNNCFKNGILPVKLPEEQVNALMRRAQEQPGSAVTVDLENQRITAGNLAPMPFEVDAFRKHCLLNGLDDIGLTMAEMPAIEAFEAHMRQEKSWI